MVAPYKNLTKPRLAFTVHDHPVVLSHHAEDRLHQRLSDREFLSLCLDIPLTVWEAYIDYHYSVTWSNSSRVYKLLHENYTLVFAFTRAKHIKIITLWKNDAPNRQDLRYHNMVMRKYRVLKNLSR